MHDAYATLKAKWKDMYHAYHGIKAYVISYGSEQWHNTTADLAWYKTVIVKFILPEEGIVNPKHGCTEIWQIFFQVCAVVHIPWLKRVTSETVAPI